MSESPWVRMDKQEPPLRIPVICGWEGDPYWVKAIYWGDGNWADEDGYPKRGFNDVTHWMPIPPLGEENE